MTKMPGHVEIDNREEFAFLSTNCEDNVYYHWINLKTGKELQQTNAKEILKIEGDYVCDDYQTLRIITMGNKIEYLLSIIYFESEGGQDNLTYLIAWTCHDFKIACIKQVNVDIGYFFLLTDFN